jgi:hypothetical protein
MDQRLLVAGLAALAGALLWAWVARTWRAARLRWRMRRARQKEALAEHILVDAGYEVLAAQVPAPTRIVCDGETLEIEVRVDYLVRRRGRIFAAEAKSGARAPDPADRGTRRQLLEYAVTYDVDGVLLVDTEEGRVIEVSFPALRTRVTGFWSGVVVGAMAVAAVWGVWGR